MNTRSQKQSSSHQADPLSARIQQRPWHDPFDEASPANEQPQGCIADFSHVDLFSHAPVRRPIQAKFNVDEPKDQYEQEDRGAEQVMSMAPPSAPNLQQQEPSVQRQEEPDEELQAKPDITALQRQEVPNQELQAQFIQRQGDEIASGDASPNLESAINSARGSGQPLDAGLQRSMGQAMGADFSEVRVHTDVQADQLNQSIQAKAFTTGQDVFFRQGAYEPRSRGGQELIAHELTHVVQQNGGAVQRSLQTKAGLSYKKPESTPGIQHKQESTETVEAPILIAEDSISNLSSGQMKKSEFLDWLYQEIHRVGTEEYVGSNLTVEQCPYIVYWFERYRRAESSHLEKALRKYSAALATLSSAEELIQLVCRRARNGFRTQVETGKITELPDDVPQAVGEGVVPEPEEIIRSSHDGGSQNMTQSPDGQSNQINVARKVQPDRIQRGTKEKETSSKPMMEKEKILGLGFANIYSEEADAFGGKGPVKEVLSNFLSHIGGKGLAGQVDPIAAGKIMVVLQKMWPKVGAIAKASHVQDRAKTWIGDNGFDGLEYQEVREGLSYLLNEGIDPMMLSEVTDIYLIDIEALTERKIPSEKGVGGTHSALHGSTIRAMMSATTIRSNLAGFSKLQITWAQEHRPGELTEAEYKAALAVTAEDKKKSKYPKTVPLPPEGTAPDDVSVWNVMDCIEGKGADPWPGEVTLVSVWEVAMLIHTPELRKKTKFHNHRSSDSSTEVELVF